MLRSVIINCFIFLFLLALVPSVRATQALDIVSGTVNGIFFPNQVTGNSFLTNFYNSFNTTGILAAGALLLVVSGLAALPLLPTPYQIRDSFHDGGSYGHSRIDSFAPPPQYRYPIGFEGSKRYDPHPEPLHSSWKGYHHKPTTSPYYYKPPVLTYYQNVYETTPSSSSRRTTYHGDNRKADNPPLLAHSPGPPYSSDTPPRSSNKKKQTVVLKVNEDTSALNLVQRLRGALASLKKEAQSETKTDLTVQHIPFINDDKAIRNRHYFKTESFSQTPLYVNSTWKRRKK